MKHNYLKIASLAALATGMAQTALAANWTTTDRQDPAAPTVIFAETDTGVALLACEEGKLKVQISDDNDDFAARMRKVAKYNRGVDVELKIGDKTSSPYVWRIYPAVDTIFSPKHTQAAKIYNAVIRGDDVQVTVDGEDYVTLTLPPVDDMFTAFSKTCKAN